jgi:hypothetical protein
MNDGHGTAFGLHRTKSGVSASFTFFAFDLKSNSNKKA